MVRHLDHLKDRAGAVPRAIAGRFSSRLHDERVAAWLGCWALWFGGAAIAHDLILAPLVLAVAVATTLVPFLILRFPYVDGRPIHPAVRRVSVRSCVYW
jgi:hypothetical protein